MVVRPLLGGVTNGAGNGAREFVRPFDPLDPARGSVALPLPEAPGDRVWIPIAGAAGQGLVRALFEASDGSIWAGTTRGLLQIEIAEAGAIGGHTAAMRALTTAHGLVSGDIRGVTEDRDGNLWLASTGAMKLTRRGFVTYTTADGLGDAAVHGIFETRAGVLSVASGDWVLNTLDGDRFRSLPLRVPPGTVRLWGSQTAVLDRDDRWWLLSMPDSWRLPAFTNLDAIDRPLPSPVPAVDVSPGVTEPIFKLFQSRSGDLWFGLSAYGRVARWEQTTGRKRLYTEADGLPADLPTAFGEDARGEIWIGFRTGRVARLRGERFTVFTAEHHVPSGEITAIHTDVSGRLWIGSTRGGLARVDDPAVSAPAFHRYTAADGLGSNNIRCLISDRDGWIYAGTARGVDRIDPAKGHVRHYTTIDGLAPGLRDVRLSRRARPPVVRDDARPLAPRSVIAAGARAAAGVDRLAAHRRLAASHIASRRAHDRAAHAGAARESGRRRILRPDLRDGRIAALSIQARRRRQRLDRPDARNQRPLLRARARRLSLRRARDVGRWHGEHAAGDDSVHRDDRRSGSARGSACSSRSRSASPRRSRIACASRASSSSNACARASPAICTTTSARTCRGWRSSAKSRSGRSATARRNPRVTSRRSPIALAPSSTR